MALAQKGMFGLNNENVGVVLVYSMAKSRCWNDAIRNLLPSFLPGIILGQSLSKGGKDDHRYIQLSMQPVLVLGGEISFPMDSAKAPKLTFTGQAMAMLLPWEPKGRVGSVQTTWLEECV